VGEGSTFKIVMGERAERPVREPDPEDEPEEAAPAEAEEPRLTLVPLGEIETPSERTPEPRRTAANGEPAGPSWTDFKVLVVDDERDSRVLIKHFLEDFGCQVFTATTGEDGLALAREHLPDLITIDLIMPGMTGWEMLKRLKADPVLRAIPVVVVSVVAGEGRGRLLGAVDLVTKPFDREDLLRVLWRNLGRRRGGRVLVMVEDETVRDRLTGLVEERGLEVVALSREAPMEVVRSNAPDALVLDVGLPSSQGVVSLLELREDRLHTGLPVLVLTPAGLNEKEREVVDDLATVHARPDAAADALTRLLDAVFPLVGVGETSG
jgi:CheY-like chemotaxis protein